MNQSSDEDHLTQSELADRWRISPRTLEKWRYLGVGVEHLKIGGRVIYRVADVRAYEEANRWGRISGAAIPEDGAS